MYNSQKPAFRGFCISMNPEPGGSVGLTSVSPDRFIRRKHEHLEMPSLDECQPLRKGQTPSPDLPREILRLITSTLDSRTLRSLARVNSSWQAAVEPILWQKVSLELVNCPNLVRWDDDIDEELESSVENWISWKILQLEAALANQPARESYTEALRLLVLASSASSAAACALIRPLIS